MLVFEERGKPEYPEKNLSEQSREPTTNSAHIWRRVRESNPGHIGGRRALSPLRQPCSHLYPIHGKCKYFHSTLQSAENLLSAACTLTVWQSKIALNEAFQIKEFR